MRNIMARLERAERLVNRAADSPCISALYESGDGWRLNFATWNGKPGSGRTTTTFHDTKGKALELYTARMWRYKTDAPLIVIDV